VPLATWVVDGGSALENNQRVVTATENGAACLRTPRLLRLRLLLLVLIRRRWSPGWLHLLRGLRGLLMLVLVLGILAPRLLGRCHRRLMCRVLLVVAVRHLRGLHRQGVGRTAEGAIVVPRRLLGRRALRIRRRVLVGLRGAVLLLRRRAGMLRRELTGVLLVLVLVLVLRRPVLSGRL
jgi:hypothetical protein